MTRQVYKSIASFSPEDLSFSASVTEPTRDIAREFLEVSRRSSETAAQHRAAFLRVLRVRSSARNDREERATLGIAWKVSSLACISPSATRRTRFFSWYRTFLSTSTTPFGSLSAVASFFDLSLSVEKCSSFDVSPIGQEIATSRCYSWYSTVSTFLQIPNN